MWSIYGFEHAQKLKQRYDIELKEFSVVGG